MKFELKNNLEFIFATKVLFFYDKQTDTQSRIPGPQKINYCNDRESQITYSNLKSCDIHFGIPESHNLMISKARSSISRFKKAGSSSFLEPIATVHHIFGSRYPRDPQWIPHVPFTNGCSELCSKRPAPFANCRLTPNCRISFEKCQGQKGLPFKKRRHETWTNG